MQVIFHEWYLIFQPCCETKLVTSTWKIVPFLSRDEFNMLSLCIFQTAYTPVPISSVNNGMLNIFLTVLCIFQTEKISTPKVVPSVNNDIKYFHSRFSAYCRQNRHLHLSVNNDRLNISISMFCILQPEQTSAPKIEPSVNNYRLNIFITVFYILQVEQIAIPKIVISVNNNELNIFIIVF